MSQATINLIADAVVSELNDSARSWAAQLTAKPAARRYSPLFTIPELLPLTVSVVPRARPQNDRVARGAVGTLGYKRVQQHRIDIAVQQKPADESNDSFDPLQLLTEEFESWFLVDAHPLSTYTKAICVGSTIDPWPALDHIEQYGAYTAVIQMLFEVYL